LNDILPTLLAAALLAISIPLSAQPDAASSSAPRWSRVADASLARQEIYPAVLDGRIYVAGGILSDAPGFTAYFEAYDAAANQWHKLSPLPEGRHHIALAAAGGKIYGIGGFSGAIPDWRAHATVFVYDPKLDRWAPGPALPQARAEGVVAAIGDNIYLIGGRMPTSADASHISQHADTNRGEVLDVRSGQWKRIADAPTARNSAAAAVIGNKIYVVGGRQMVTQPNGSQRPVNVATLEVYDPANDRWETRSPMPLAQGGLAAASYKGRLYAFGGEQFVPERKVFAEAWVYDPASDRWTALPKMPTPRHGHGAAVVGNRVFLIGGGEKVGVAASRVHEALEFPADKP
jgi:N-acetylneuraminic acid mutarotase